MNLRTNHLKPLSLALVSAALLSGCAAESAVSTQGLSGTMAVSQQKAAPKGVLYVTGDDTGNDAVQIPWADANAYGVTVDGDGWSARPGTPRMAVESDIIDLWGVEPAPDDELWLFPLTVLNHSGMRADPWFTIKGCWAVDYVDAWCETDILVRDEMWALGEVDEGVMSDVVIPILIPGQYSPGSAHGALILKIADDYYVYASPTA